MTGLSIRLAETVDASEIARVHIASWREAYSDILPEKLLKTLDLHASTAKWTSIISAPSSAANKVLVLQRAAEIVGFGACGLQRTADLIAAGYDGEIGAIYVLNAAKSGGGGRALMRHMAGYLALQGLKGLSLWVLEENMRARIFYERQGGCVCGQREETLQGALLMEVAYGWSDLTALAA